MSFIDLSGGGPTRWSWDLDGDGAPDSAAPNPSFTYNTPGAYGVSLTVWNSCFNDTRTSVAFVRVFEATSNTASADLFEFQLNEVRGAKTSCQRGIPMS